MKRRIKNIVVLLLAFLLFMNPFTAFAEVGKNSDTSEQDRIELIEKFEAKLAEAKEIKDDGNTFPGAYDLLQKDIQTAERNFNNNKETATLEKLQQYYDGFLVAINGYEDSYYTDLIDVEKALREEDSEETILKVGTINITNKKYHEASFSMSNGAIVNPAKIIQTNKGYKLIYSFKSLNILIYKGFLGKLFVSERGDEKGSETFHEMNPLSYYTVQDYYNHPETGKDEILKGKFYPKEFIVPVYQDYNPVYIQVYVPVMEEIMSGGGTQKARLFLDWDSLDLKDYANPYPMIQTLENKIAEAKELPDGDSKFPDTTIEETGKVVDGAYSILQKDIERAEKNLNENRKDPEKLKSILAQLEKDINLYKESNLSTVQELQRALTQINPKEKIIEYGTINIKHTMPKSSDGSLSLASLVRPMPLIKTNHGYKAIYTFKPQLFFENKLFRDYLKVSNKGQEFGNLTFQEPFVLTRYSTYTSMAGSMNNTESGHIKEVLVPIYEDYNPYYVQTNSIFTGEPEVGRAIVDWDSLNMKVVLNETPLREKIAEAEGIQIGEKTQEAFDKLQGKIKEAKATLESGMTNEEINAGTTALQEAIDAFYNSPDKVIPVDKTALINAITEAEKLDTSNKTNDTVTVFQDALQQAKAINEKESATNEEVQTALTNLQNAIKGLEEKEPIVPEKPTILDYQNLPDGTYDVDMSIMHYSRENEKKSMADGAVIKPAQVVVENGQYYLQMEMTSLQFMGFTGYLGDLHYLGEDGTFHQVEILSYYDIKDNFYQILVDYYHEKHPNVGDEDIKYPHTLRYPIPKPTGEIQETVAQVFVPVMESLGDGGGTQKCLPTINWRPFITENEPEPDQPKPDLPHNIDLSKLRQEIILSEGKNYNDYTPESWNEFSVAKTQAIVLSFRTDLTQKEVDNATKLLKSKREALVKASSDNHWGGNVNPGDNSTPNTPGTETPSNINTYEVPVEVLKAYDSGYSMANNAINHTATVIEQNGTYTYYVQFVPMEKEFGGQNFVGNLTKLFVYQPSKTVASSYANNVWAFTRNQKDSKVKVAVWVDAMDEIAGGTPGAGEQDAILSFDWSKAKLVSKGKAEAPEFKPAPPVEPKVEEKKPTTERKEPVTSTFTDIVNHWAKTAIEYVVEKGYFKGTSTTTFTPNRGITRGEFVTVLGRIAKVDTGQYTGSNFKDVKGDTFYAPYVNWAESLGVVKGTGQNAFEPNRTLTREEMAVIMARYLKTFNVKLKETETTTFNDGGSIAPWAKDAVNEMAKQGVIKGMEDGNFSPKTNFTRAQVAQVLYNIDHK